MIFVEFYATYKLIGVETGRLQEALLCAKAKRQQQQQQQQQSVQSERKSTIRYGEDPKI
ncbi:hypothetical protein [Lysinibacillus xylanilyticus]|uniref:hypothetical protein n=1 Tax=Lysinibacillus xylanilyticus TaxID=582475 RepID=UPI003D0468EA